MKTFAGSYCPRRRRVLCLLLVFLLLVPLCASGERKVFWARETEPFPEGAELLTVRVAGLFSADCMLVTLGEHSMFVDLGIIASMKQIKEVIREAGISEVEYFFNSHPHNDHIGGFMPLVESGFPVGTMMTFFPHMFIAKNTMQLQAVKTAETHHIPITDMKTGDTIPFGSAEVTAYRVPKHRTDLRLDVNDLSAMLMIRYGDCSILLTADVEHRAQRALVEEYGSLLKADIMKVPHHGVSAAEFSFLDAVDPEFVFFTRYPTGTRIAQKQLAERGVRRMAFSTWGVITLQTDGHKWIASQNLNPEMEHHVRLYQKEAPWLELPFTLPR